MTLYEELKARGLVAQITDDEIIDLINNGKATFYIGFDCTADSLTAGHFMALTLMKRLQMAGNKPIALIGGGTTMIGDPSGRTDMRKMLTKEDIAHNAACFKKQMEKFIDFSSPAAVEKALPYCKTHKLPIVVCTTGLSEELQLKVVQLSRSVPVFKSANMSMGINVLAELCKRASAVLGINYDIEIVEQHHHNKLDAPSGTALMLADAINEENNGAYHYVYDRSSVRQKRDPKEIGISSVRGGSIVGDHEVLFCGPDEVITLRHTAYSRSIFANGAVNAAVYLAKKEPGLYDMGDLIAAL